LLRIVNEGERLESYLRAVLPGMRKFQTKRAANSIPVMLSEERASEAQLTRSRSIPTTEEKAAMGNFSQSLHRMTSLWNSVRATVWNFADPMLQLLA